MKLAKTVLDMVGSNESLAAGKSARDQRLQAIAWVIRDEKFSDKDLQNLYTMVVGNKPADFKPAKKVLDKIQHRVKYTIDGFGLQDVRDVLDNMGISEAKIQLDYMDIGVLAEKPYSSSIDPKSIFAAINQIAASRKLNFRNKKEVFELAAKYKQAKSESEKSKIEDEYKKILGVNN